MPAQWISKARFYHDLWNEFWIPDNVKDQLERHFILKMPGHQVKHILREDGTITWMREEYIFICSAGLTREMIFSADRVKLSFRKPRDHSIAAVVLVRKDNRND